MRKARLGSRDKALLICSLSEMMGNTYDVVYDIVYDIMITSCISYTISYACTMSYTMCNIRHRIRCRIRYRMRYPLLPPLRLIPPVLLHRPRACASGFQLPCVLTLEHASASSPLHQPLRSFWGTPSSSSTVLPHPDVDLEKQALCPAVRPGISSCTVWNMVPQGVRNCVVFVPAEEARNQRDPAKNVFHGADIKCWKLGGSPLIQHGNTIPQ
jgi:hypothetical protein